MLKSIRFGTFYFFFGTMPDLTLLLSTVLNSSLNSVLNCSQLLSSSQALNANLILTLVFCVILFVWVLFFVPETRGVRIEEMDKLFGGSEGKEDIERIRAIRESLGLVAVTEASDKKDHLVNQEHIE